MRMLVIHHEGGTPGRGRFTYSNRQTFVERWKTHLATALGVAAISYFLAASAHSA